MYINYKAWERFWEKEMSEENPTVIYVCAAEAITHNPKYSDNEKTRMMQKLSNVWNKQPRK